MQRSLGALVLASLAVLSACGGGDSDPAPSQGPAASGASETPALPNDQAYFEALEVAFEETHTEAETIRASLQAGVAPVVGEAERRQAILDYGQAYTTYAADTRARIEAIVPPDIASSQHAALIAAATGLVDLSASLTAGIEQAQPSGEAGFNAIYFDSDGPALEQRFRDACYDLQSLAAASEIDVAYQCAR